MTSGSLFVQMLPPVGLEEQPGSSFCTNFVHSSRFKVCLGPAGHPPEIAFRSPMITGA